MDFLCLGLDMPIFPYLLKKRLCFCSGGQIARRSSRRAFGRHVRLGHAAIHDEIRTIHEAALITGKEDRGMGLLDRFAETTSRKVHLASESLLLVVAEEVLQHWCTAKETSGSSSIKNHVVRALTSAAPDTAN